MTIVVVQCRLSSTRLPRKALLPLGGRPLVAWTLESMSAVKADRHVLAVDYDSEKELAPVAREYGWECFAGPADDVLERFCQVAKWSECVEPNDFILRATADNPFLFYEAAVQLLDEAKKNPCDYVTFTGLPHGSGVEVFCARSLIESCGMTDSSYDHEHVGPALYNHPENFLARMIPSPARWKHPEYRTTVDTYDDYRRALRIVRHVSGTRSLRRPYTTEEICSAFLGESVVHPVLCVPTVAKGHGTGHLRRCLEIACKTGADIYIPSTTGLVETDELVQEALNSGMESWQVVNELPEKQSYDLIVTDAFSINKNLVKKLSDAAPVLSIDEGSQFTSYCDYLLDIIPSAKLNRKPNLRNIGFIPLPKNRKDFDGNKPCDLQKVLVSIGGEDPCNLSVPVAVAMALCGKNVTIIVVDPVKVREKIPEKLKKNIRVVPPVSNLKERLHMYDVVVTHYGFTAFEAVAAGCAVVLVETSSLHGVLADQYGFALLRRDEINPDSILSVLGNPNSLYPKEVRENLSKNEGKSLDEFIVKLAAGEKMSCPLCSSQKQNVDLVVARTKDRTFRQCSSCGILYMSWTTKTCNAKYEASYFLEDYKKQYGKTYLEDFPEIKMRCIARMSVLDSIFWSKSRVKAGAKKTSSITPTVLDIGCAMGPFMAAASDSGWQVYGVDVSKEAVEFVQNNLRYPAVCAAFPVFNSVDEFGIGQFDAITMWYVIEHFKNLDSVLKSVSSMLKIGGVFAFSTPSATGVSARFFPDKFFNESPEDHFTIWNPSRVKTILKKYGFKVVKVISTGHHGERFPVAQRKKIQEGSFAHSLLTGVSKCCGLGDTFEAYCIKVSDSFKKDLEGRNE